MIEFTIPLWPIFIAVMLGAVVSVLAFIILMWRFYQATDMARHSAMARQVHALRRKYNDWSDLTGLDPFPPHLR